MSKDDKLSLGNNHLGGQVYNVLHKSRHSGAGRWQRRVTFSLRLPTLVVLGVGSLLLVGWIFFLGVLLGRGYMPEDTIPQLEDILPRTAETAPARIVDASGQAQSTAGQSSAGSLAGGSASSPTQGLPAGISNAGQVQNSASAATSTQTRTSTPAANTVQRTDNAPAARQPQPASQSSPAASATATTAEVFDYVFQVAAYKDKQSAEAFAAKLKKDKFSPQVVAFKDAAGTSWYRVNLPLRGTADDVGKLQEQMKKYGITKIIRQSKQPVKR